MSLRSYPIKESRVSFLDENVLNLIVYGFFKEKFCNLDSHITSTRGNVNNVYPTWTLTGTVLDLVVYQFF
jgi:hypothetical protein